MLFLKICWNETSAIKLLGCCWAWVKFRATWVKISGDVSLVSGDLTVNRVNNNDTQTPLSFILENRGNRPKCPKWLLQNSTNGLLLLKTWQGCSTPSFNTVTIDKSDHPIPFARLLLLLFFFCQLIIHNLQTSILRCNKFAPICSAAFASESFSNDANSRKEGPCHSTANDVTA